MGWVPRWHEVWALYQVLLPAVLLLNLSLQSLSKRKRDKLITSKFITSNQKGRTYVDTKPLVCPVSKLLFLRPCSHHRVGSYVSCICLEMTPASVASQTCKSELAVANNNWNKAKRRGISFFQVLSYSVGEINMLKNYYANWISMSEELTSEMKLWLVYSH